MIRKKVKFNPDLLNEELKKYKLLSEYSFYTGENDLTKTDDKDLLLGDVDEAADESKPDDLEPVDADTDGAANDVAADLGVDDQNPGNDEETSGDIGEPEPAQDTEPVAEPASAPAAPESEDVEIDVTALVKGSEEAKSAADNASQNTGQLLAKFSELEGKVAKMDNITKKIDDLEKEIVKRNPTPVEKLEMQSLNSFPYSLKLTDYWNEKEGSYDVTGQEGKKEYVLTKDDVNGDYSESQIKQSFKARPEGNLYEEEDIN